MIRRVLEGAALALVAALLVVGVVLLVQVGKTNAELRQANLEQCMASAGVDRTSPLEEQIAARSQCLPSES